MNSSCRCHESVWPTETERLQHEADYWKRKYEAKCVEARLFQAAHRRVKQGLPEEAYEKKRTAKLRRLIEKERREMAESARQMDVIIQQWAALWNAQEDMQERIDRQLALITEREDRLAAIFSAEA